MDEEYYVKPKRLKELLVDYYESDVISDELALAVKSVAERLSRARNFINYTYREEMVGDAVVKIFSALEKKKFDITKSNAFSYFTTVAYHAFINRIKKEKQMHEALTKYRDIVYQNEMNEAGIYVPTHNNNEEE